jgi:hypothetical protein
MTTSAAAHATHTNANFAERERDPDLSPSLLTMSSSLVLGMWSFAFLPFFHSTFSRAKIFSRKMLFAARN